MMNQWIPFGQGTYAVDQAFIVTPAFKAVALLQTVVDVHEGPRGVRSLVGRGKAANALVVDLLEDHDRLDVLLNFGAPFTFWLQSPDIQAGKVFAPGVAATIQFTPQNPWQVLSAAEWQNIIARIERID
jgi:hypothetical protein